MRKKSRSKPIELIILECLENMISINYDITKDEFYLRGLEKGMEKAKKIKAQVEKEKQEAVAELLREGHFTQKRIAQILSVSIAFIRKVKKEMKE